MAIIPKQLRDEALLGIIWLLAFVGSIMQMTEENDQNHRRMIQHANIAQTCERIEDLSERLNPFAPADVKLMGFLLHGLLLASQYQNNFFRRDVNHLRSEMDRVIIPPPVLEEPSSTTNLPNLDSLLTSFDEVDIDIEDEEDDLYHHQVDIDTITLEDPIQSQYEANYERFEDDGEDWADYEALLNRRGGGEDREAGERIVGGGEDREAGERIVGGGEDREAGESIDGGGEDHEGGESIDGELDMVRGPASRTRPENLCWKCGKEGTLLICSRSECSSKVHKECSKCPFSVDEDGNLHCPLCWYDRLVTEYIDSQKLLSSAKRRLVKFLPILSTGSKRLRLSIDGGGEDGEAGESIDGGREDREAGESIDGDGGKSQSEANYEIFEDDGEPWADYEAFLNRRGRGERIDGGGGEDREGGERIDGGGEDHEEGGERIDGGGEDREAGERIDGGGEEWIDGRGGEEWIDGRGGEDHEGGERIDGGGEDHEGGGERIDGRGGEDHEGGGERIDGSGGEDHEEGGERIDGSGGEERSGFEGVENVAQPPKRRIKIDSKTEITDAKRYKVQKRQLVPMNRRQLGLGFPFFCPHSLFDDCVANKRLRLTTSREEENRFETSPEENRFETSQEEAHAESPARSYPRLDEQNIYEFGSSSQDFRSEAHGEEELDNNEDSDESDEWGSMNQLHSQLCLTRREATLLFCEYLRLSHEIKGSVYKPLLELRQDPPEEGQSYGDIRIRGRPRGPNDKIRPPSNLDLQ